VVTLGSYVVAAFAFILLLRFFPLFELPIAAGASATHHLRSRLAARRSVLLLSLFAGLSMIAWGVVTRESDLGPVKWLAGIVLLAGVPLGYCLIKDAPVAETGDTDA
jgi:hypothetical protein